MQIAIMKTRYLVSAAISLLVLAGCASNLETTDIPVRLGMSRSDLRLRFGEPLRIEPVASGGEDWYYRFTSWKTHPTSASGTTFESGEVTSYVSTGLEFSQDTEERPVHTSASGFVVEPLPDGKVVRN